MIAKNETKGAVTTATRLPETVVPERYKLRLNPDIAGGTFAGEVSITVDVREPVTSIDLNAAGLTVTVAKITDDKGTTFTGVATHNEDAQRVSIAFNGTVGLGKRVLTLTYTGILDPKLRGFYKSTYKDADGNQQANVVTKFEPSDARRAFPCWDEPAFKAVFEMSLEVDADLTAISNASIASTETLPGGKKLVKFEPSIKMSSYLAAWVVGRFESSEPVMSRNCEIRVWSLPGKKHLHAFALEIGKYSLDVLADYFDIPYPSNKLDLIAIPDFASGAMENFGCVTFRETALLVDPATASPAEFKRVANVTSHENAHMWFGDYATMFWWNGLWLNEAAATYLAIMVLEKFRPNWNVWDEFNIDKAAAFRIDGLNSTRSIEFPVATPEDARAMFDVLTYEKGCAVLRMLELYIGSSAFRQGMRNYLRDNAFANADTPRLWAAMEAAAKAVGSDIPVSDMMQGWVFQPGYPVVTVSLADTAGSITVQQKRFTYLNQGKPAPGQWHIPLAIRANTADGKFEQTVALTDQTKTIYVGTDPKLVVVNADGQGFYRVNYSEDLRKKLFDSLGSLSVSERFNLIADLWANVLSGDASLASYLDAAKKLCVDFNEKDPHVWSVVIASLSYLRRALPANAEALPRFMDRVRDLLSPKLKQLGNEPVAGESEGDAELRGSLLAALSNLGDAETQGRMKTLFQRYSADRKAVDTNLVQAAIDGTATSGDASAYDEFIAMRQSATTPQEEARLLFALTSFKQADLIDRLLQSVLSGEVRTQDLPSVLLKLFNNPAATVKTWEFVKNNWDYLVATLPLQGIIRLVEGVVSLVDPSREPEVREFLGKHTVKGSEKAVAQSLELLKIACLLQTRENDILSGK